MEIIVILFILIYNVCSIKIDLNRLSTGFINYGINSGFGTRTHTTSIYKLNKHKNKPIFSLESNDESSSPGFRIGDLPHLGQNNFKLRGIKLENSVVPLSDYVLIVKSDAVDVTQSGVYLGTKKTRDFIGRVLAVGPGRLNKTTGVTTPLSVSVGDTVLFDSPYESIDLKYNDKPCALVREEQIFARLNVGTHELDNRITYDKVVPLFDRMLVRVLESPKRTESGLVISSSNTRDEVVKAKIVSLGPGSYTESGKLVPIVGLSVGDTVLYRHNEYDSGEFTSNNVNYAFVRRDAVLGKL
ncbi:Chaperonin 10 Kd subunit family protein [Theileria parva strain Muguga]|uniref:Chaperonin 10 Kd subunit family protein n=1 Tax=Theileria parva strain Muguga TaxID=333668 RepID=UPI001C620FB3|nr:Chaperonin 10 Kd subunit family protein [Theileria parva strain Muguga]EAN32594.2 Chaperonin 10 Kd subunit family protein [Theileria parva strain Muguga]